ncbi:MULTISPECIES: patatin-like phospholipase family protein [unclassified Wenzhouxiangella]|uniref:patatin-like phospholipase family protein n=1 Tax=unclassified Wenzhouxiangella TaxID=2613841 RepID=UPI000E326B4B|nr:MULTISPECIES: patatin-like phospholipase family protein [unclassified Wenzhouxiangella]RFF28109.1 serine protease [Wenzhouxiangella sp. 15181]RFP68094.1 serine protease [Wenzhouxiangella sp. 15190]
MTTNRKSLAGHSVSLVLGSGGARGLAHIGVIHALEKAGLEIRHIAGSSMGAVIGGIHAAGRLDAYEEWVCQLEQSDVLALVDWSFSGGGLIRGRKIINKLADLIGRYDIEDLDTEFTAVAVDLDQGREVWLDRGPLFDAIRASIAIPGVFTPHEYRGRTLIDGGILNPVPIAPTLRAISDLVVVVDVNAPAVHPPPLEKQREETDDDDSMLRRVREFMNGWRDNNPSEKDERPGLMAVMMRALDTMEAAIARHHMAIFRSDIMVSVPKNTCFVHEFHRASEVIALGEKLANEALASTDMERLRHIDRP